jgi:hypothetical protein
MQTERTTRPWITILCALAVTLAAGLYTRAFIYRGWIPHDDGLHAQMSERAFNGELSHVDYDDTYTGGLNYLHALFFKIFGISFRTIRFTQFLFFLFSVPVIFWLAHRVANLVVAAVFTLASVAWALPNFPVPSPNWYTLTFCIFSVGLLFLFLQSDKRRYLILSGLCIGVTILIKITGLYYLAAAALFLLHHENVTLAGGDQGDQGGKRRGAGFFVCKTIFLLLVPAAVLFIIFKTLSFQEVFHYLVPAAILSLAMIGAEWRMRAISSGVRFRRVLRLFLPFLAGCAIPVLFFAGLYIARGHLRELLYGVFVMPTRRYLYGARELPPPVTLLSIIPIFIYFLLPRLPLPRKVVVTVLGLFSAGLFGLLFASSDLTVYRFVWLGIREVVPAAALLGCFYLFKTCDRTERAKPQNQGLFLLISLLTLLSLIQYPFQLPLYLLFFTPVIFLTVLYYVRSAHPSYSVHYIPLVFFGLIWAVVWVNGTNFFQFGFRYEAMGRVAPLSLQRAGISVQPDWKKIYETLIPLVRNYGGDSPYILAFPDSPEVYFLAEKKNPTRAIYDYFQPRWEWDDLKRMLDEKNIKVVVVRNSRWVEFSKGYVSDQLLENLMKAFPRRYDLDYFLVLARM